MKLIITETQLLRLIKEQSFYPTGCRPTYREDPHGHAYEKTSTTTENFNGTYSGAKRWVNQVLPDLKKKERWGNDEFQTAKEDLYKSMDSTSRKVYNKLAKEEHPLYYYLVHNYATVARNRVTLYKPKYADNPHSIAKVNKYKYALKNWVTTLNDLGNDDYSWNYKYDVVLKEEGTD